MTLAWKPKRIADRDGQLTDAQRLGIGQAHMPKLRRIDADDGEIGVGIVADQLRGIFASVRQADRDLIRVVHDVAVGQNKSVRRDDKTGAAAADFSRALPAAPLLFDVDVNDGRARRDRPRSRPCANIHRAMQRRCRSNSHAAYSETATRNRPIKRSSLLNCLHLGSHKKMID